MAKEPSLSKIEQQSQKVDLFLCDPPYDLQRDQNDDHIYNIEFASNYVKDMAKMLEYVMKPGANTNIFFSTLQHAFWYKALALKTRQEEARTREVSEESDTES